MWNGVRSKAVADYRKCKRTHVDYKKTVKDNYRKIIDFLIIHKQLEQSDTEQVDKESDDLSRSPQKRSRVGESSDEYDDSPRRRIKDERTGRSLNVSRESRRISDDEASGVLDSLPRSPRKDKRNESRRYAASESSDDDDSNRFAPSRRSTCNSAVHSPTTSTNREQQLRRSPRKPSKQGYSFNNENHRKQREKSQNDRKQREDSPIAISSGMSSEDEISASQLRPHDSSRNGNTCI